MPRFLESTSHIAKLKLIIHKSLRNIFYLLTSLFLIIIINCHYETDEYNHDYLKGMNIFFQKSTRNVYNEKEYQHHLDEINSIGINSIFLIPIHYCTDEFTDTIKETDETLDDSTLSRIIEQTQQNGFRVILKPHIDVENGKPRFMIQPTNMNKWLNFYTEILIRYINLSNKYGLSEIVIGTEIDNIADSPEFHKIIKQLKSLYNGSMIYSASFDHFLSTDLWKHIDIIGINAYYNLCNNKYCTESELTEGWNNWLTIIDNFASGKGMPVVITECGFYSREGCAINPGDWSEAGEVSTHEQAKSYEALLCQAASFSHIKGIFWWQWELNNPWNDNSKDYTPKDKPAEDVIKKYWYN